MSDTSVLYFIFFMLGVLIGLSLSVIIILLSLFKTKAGNE